MEQHAEAAADEIDDEMGDNNGTPIEVIVFRHMQSAIDEATAPLRARIAELEGMGPLIEEYAEYRESSGIAGANCDRMERRRQDGLADEAKLQITAILTGGAP